VLATVLDQPEGVVIDALEAAWRARLLEDVDGGYRIAHDLIREVLEADLGPARRAILHRRAAEVLEGRPGAASAEVLAYHYRRSDVPERAVGYLEQAGDQAQAQHGLAAAEGFYREAVEHLDRLGRPLDAARLREKLGEILRTMAQFTQALAVLEQAVPALQLAGDADGLCRLVAQIGRVHANRGTLEEGIAQVQAHLERLTMGDPSPGLAALYDTLGFLYFLRGQLDASLAEGIRSADMARATGDNRLLARAQARRGQTLVMMGRAEQALPLLHEAGELAEAAGDLNVLGSAAPPLAIMAEDRGEFEQAGQYASRMLAAGERLGSPILVRRALFRLAAQAFFTGAWSEAHACMQRVQDLPDRSSSEDAYALLELGRLALAEGEREQATRYLAECCALLRNAGHVYLTAASLLAECEVLEGRPKAALARLLPLVGGDDMWGRVVTIYVLPVLAWAYLELGDTNEATRTIEEALRRQRAGQYWFCLVDALRVQALITQQQGDLATAERALEEGLALAGPMPYPYGEGRLLAVYGQLHLQRGERGPARERLEAALAIFQRLGARKDAAQVEQAVAALRSCAEAEPDPLSLAAYRTEAHATTGTRLARADRQAWAMERLRTAGPLSPGAYASALGVSVDTALRDLQQLVHQGLVQAAGRTKNRRYTLAGETAGTAIHRRGL
jgi:tetratricopeptide (TPR) repeat protein